MFFLGIIVGIGATLAVLGFAEWAKDKGYTLNWWKWLVLAVWVLMLVVTIVFIGANIGESELRAAGFGGAVFGVMTIFAGVGIWRWFFFIPKQTAKKSSAKASA